MKDWKTELLARYDQQAEANRNTELGAHYAADALYIREGHTLAAWDKGTRIVAARDTIARIEGQHGAA